MKLFFRLALLSVSFVSCELLNCEVSGVSACENAAVAEPAAGSQANVVETGEYAQQVHVGYRTSEGLPADQSNGIVIDGDTVVAATQAGLVRFSGGAWVVIQKTSTPVPCLARSKDRIWYIEGNGIFSIAAGSPPRNEGTLPAATLANCILVTDNRVFVGTDRGLLGFSAGDSQPVEAVNQQLSGKLAIRQLAQHGSEVAVAADGGLVTLNTDAQTAALQYPRDHHVGWALQDVRGVGYDAKGSLWFAASQGVGKRMEEGWKLYTGHEGLPWNDFTCLATGVSEDVWFGTHLGAIRFTGDTWEYRQGKRWLLDDNVNAIALSKNGDAWLATPSGISCIESRPMTLKRKAAIFNKDIDHFHKRTEYGYVDACDSEESRRSVRMDAA